MLIQCGHCPHKPKIPDRKPKINETGILAMQLSLLMPNVWWLIIIVAYILGKHDHNTYI